MLQIATNFEPEYKKLLVIFLMNMFQLQNNENVDSIAFKWMRKVKDQVFIVAPARLIYSLN